ncbi:MAG: hypothetical protein M3066_07065 [Actinomycetota bacterium]|nr:hypothetical protein [Actinomycetota bacterium]
MSTTIRVTERTRDRITALANVTGRPVNAVVEEALDALERRNFFHAFNERYRDLRRDADAWADIEADRASESAVLNDGT